MINKKLHSSNFLITGGSGFIGTNLINLLLKTNCSKIYNIDFNPPTVLSHKKYWINCDIRNLSRLKKHISNIKPDYIIHLAARTDLNGKTLREYSTNTSGTKNLINCCINIKKIVFIHTSTTLVNKNGYTPKSLYDYNPATVYGESKVISEKFFLNSKIKFKYFIVRPTLIWGPYFSEPLYRFFSSIKKGYYFNPMSEPVYKTWGHVENSCKQILYLVSSHRISNSEKIFYLGDPKPIEVYTVAKMINKSFKNIIPIFKIPRIFSFCIAIFCEIFIFFQPPLTRFKLKNISTSSVYKIILKIKNPISLKKGIKQTIKWMEKNND
jgi:nucleoside-diphosphate-sugar epimerase